MVSESILDTIRPVGSQRSRMYGLPKVHKEDVPLRPILNTIKSSQRPVAEYLKILLQPVYDKYSTYCVSDSYTFVNDLKSVHFSKDDESYLCSFDIKSLFTNIPLKEVVPICANALYEDANITPPPFPREVFIEFLEFATCGVEFSFNNVISKQTDGLGMGGVLSSILSNIYVGYLEMKVFSSPEVCLPRFYKRYVDDTFALFSCKSDSQHFYSKLNSVSSLEFTVEEEAEDHSLPFLDVLVRKTSDGFVTSVYRKPTFSGSYLKWSSFSPYKRKVSLIEILIDRAVKVCSKSELTGELNRIRKIFQENGYPNEVIDKVIRRTISKPSSTFIGPKKDVAYLKLPFKGNPSEKFSKSINSYVSSTYNSVNVRVIFSTQSMLHSNLKDTLPKINKSEIVYQFTCNRCDSEYIGKSSRQLSERIKEHVPSQIRRSQPTIPDDESNHDYALRDRQQSTQRPLTIPSYNISSVRLHLLENPACADKYNDNCFKVLAQGRSKFHLSVLESIFINNRKPYLCRQKDFLYSLKLFRNF